MQRIWSLYKTDNFQLGLSVGEVIWRCMDGAMKERPLTSAKQCSTSPAAALYDANKRSTPISPAMQLIEKVLTNELGCVGGGGELNI